MKNSKITINRVEKTQKPIKWQTYQKEIPKCWKLRGNYEIQKVVTRILIYKHPA